MIQEEYHKRHNNISHAFSALMLSPPHFTGCVLAVFSAFSHWSYAVHGSNFGCDGDEIGMTGEPGESDDPAGDDINMKTTTHPSAPNVIRKGDNYWYTDRDGIMKRVEVVEIDHSIDPPSFAIRVDWTVRETEASRLSLHPMSRGSVSGR
jgi:hypothetical protein